MKKMLRLFTTFLVVSLFISFSANAQNRTVNKSGNYNGVVRIKIDQSIESTFRAKFTAKAGKFQQKLTKSASSSYLSIGIPALDKKNREFFATSYKRVFRYAGKFEAKHKAYGLHLWYEIEFASKASIQKFIKAYKQVRGVSIVEAVPHMMLVGATPAPNVLTEEPNDSQYSTQWHYNNTGQSGGTVDADIDLPEAWEIETGNSEVIVAIQDQGVDYSHVDLDGNMWHNTGEIAGNGIDDDNNGYVDDYYGYNFGDGKGEIEPGEHGTHVGGTVAAETNNGTGVAGIAGGTGNNDGVRLMSVQVFGASNQNGFDEGFIYSADMGAHISQNSWGGGGESQSINDAIDYFIANGGSAGSPMQGGVVIFAAGNSNTSTGSSTYPSQYESAIAVASTDHNDVRSSFSNYGSWVDIAAPGSDIYSCEPGNQYQGMSGTSMACPHVSGVAALIVSHHAGNITPAEVRNRLLTYVDDISANNSSYNGQLGSGRLNAYAAITGTTPPEPPKTFCHSQGNNVSDEWIADVTIGDFTNTSAGVGYQDFTDQTVDLVAGESFDVTLTPGFASTTYNEYWKIWIDYNNDTTFTDDELAFDAGAVSKNAVSGQINVPADANGIVRMRVSMKYNAAQSACESFSYGEVEDYNVSITNGGPVDNPPTAPSNLTASNITTSSINLSWTASTDDNSVAGYDVYQNGSLLTTTTSTSYSVTGLNDATTYSFYVIAKDDANQESSASNTINVTTDEEVDDQAPTTPSSLTASNVTETSVDLTWNASTDNVGVTGYDVYQDGSLYSTVTGTAVAVSGLTASTTYSFYVVAKDAAGNISSASNTINATTDEAVDTQAPTAPSSLSASNITETSVDLSWNASTDNVAVTGYDVYQDGSLYSTLTGTAVAVSGLTASTTYSFYVVAKDAAGNTSSASNTINVTTDDAPSGDCYTSSVTLSLTFDNYPTETSWSLTNGSGATVASGNGYSVKNATITEDFNIENGDYTFTINDSYGDGICCSYGNGSYSLTDANSNVIVSGGNFGSSEATNFCISGNSTPPGGGDMPEGYCATKGNNANYEWIDLVRLGSIDNTTGNDGGYADYTSMSTDLAASTQYTIYISAGFSSSSYTEFWHIWIDYNRDGDFNDAGEEVASGSSNSSATLSAAFTTPATMSSGTTMMRVTMKYNSAATSCETFTYGEVEDYAVNLGTTTYAAKSSNSFNTEKLDSELPSYTLYPIPARDFVNLKMSVIDNVNVIVYNSVGKIVKSEILNGNKLNISDLKTGVYTIKINDGNKQTIKKFVKK